MPPRSQPKPHTRSATTRFLATGLLALLTQSVQSADWPRWRGPENNGHAPAAVPTLKSLPATAERLWTQPAGDGLASPVVARGIVYAFDAQDGQETLRALRAQDGSEVWRRPIDKPFSDSQGPTGPRNTPLVDDDRVYAVSCRGRLVCLRTSDGSEVWQASYVDQHQATFIGEIGSAQGAARHGNNSSPLIDGDQLIAFVGGTNGAGVVAFGKRDGAVVWKSTSDQAAYAPPVVTTLHGERQVVCFNANGVVGLRRSDGLERWRFPIRTAFARHVTTPLVHGDRVVVSSHQAGLFGLRVSRSGESWSVAPDWVSKEHAINFASPVAVGGHLYGLGPRKNLICVEIATGNLAWSQDGVFLSSPDKAYGGFLVVGTSVLTLTDSGELALFPADPKAYANLGRLQVIGANWTNPALADGVLYVRDGNKKGGNWAAYRISQ